MGALVILLVLGISRLTTCGLIPYHGVTIGINANSGPVHSSYFHEQDQYGQYVYGYASKYHAKDEVKTADGITRGGYSYIDANGILQTVEYISDPVNGFRVSASNIPRDLPEVALAKVQHYHAYENIRREHAILAAKLAETSPIPLSPVPIENSYIAPVHTSNVLPVVTTEIEPIPYVPKEVHYIPVPVSNQYHSQDGYGQYSYGYTGPLSSKSEYKTPDSVTRGGYSYIDANGVLQSVQYISEPINGFRVQATNLPEAPQVTLVGPKVTTSVVAPRENHALVSDNHNSIPLVAQITDSQPLASETYVDPVVLTKSPDDRVFNSPEISQKIHSIPFRSNGRILTQDYPPELNIHQGKIIRNTEFLEDGTQNVASSHNIQVYQRPAEQYNPQYGSSSLPAPQNSPQAFSVPQKPELVNNHNIPIPDSHSHVQNQRVLVPQGNVGAPISVLSGQSSQATFGDLNLAQEGYEQPNLQVYQENGPQVVQAPPQAIGATPRAHISVLVNTPAPENVRINLHGANFGPNVSPVPQVNLGTPNYQGAPSPVNDLRISLNPNQAQVVHQPNLQPQIYVSQGEVNRPQVVLNQGALNKGRVQLQAQALGQLNLQDGERNFSPTPIPNGVYQGAPGSNSGAGHVVVTARPEFVPSNGNPIGQNYGGQISINFSPQPVQERVYSDAASGSQASGPVLVTSRPEFVPSNGNRVFLNPGIPEGNAIPVNFSPRPIPEGIHPGQSQGSLGARPVLVSPRPENRVLLQPGNSPNYVSSGNAGSAVNYSPRPAIENVYSGPPQANLAPGPVLVPANGNISPNPALFTPDQANIQQVQQPVSSISIGELDLKDANIFEDVSPDDINDPNVSIGNGYIIRGPTHNPNKQVSGFFNQTLYY